MKKILSGTVAAIALIATPAVAQTNQLHYAGTAPIPYTITNPQNAPFPLNVIGIAAGQAGVAAEVGTRYRAQADAPADSETATPTVDVEFALSGTVNRDCSFYAGNNSNARNIDFGVIGVRTGDNENVNQAFEMAGDVEVEVETLTAGCNFNNKVEIVKNNVNGLVNTAPGGYDTTRFQANIPYSVKARWFGVAQGAPTGGSNQTLTVSESQLSNNSLQGAWRSDMSIDILAPAISNKGLVAGTYTGTTTLTLTAS